MHKFVLEKWRHLYHSMMTTDDSTIVRPIPKGQMKSECIYQIIDFPKYQRKNLMDSYPESLFRLGMLCTHE